MCKDESGDIMKGADYESKTEEYFSYGRPEMVRFVPEGVQRVLEVGCGSGHFAAGLKRQRGVHVTAIEPFPHAHAEARARVDRLVPLQVEEAFSQLEDRSFDCVVFNDVLEHLVDPWKVLSDVLRLLLPGGVVVASLPNMRYYPVLKELVLQGSWQYQADGVLDRTHLRFFTKSSLRQLFESSGYRVRLIEGINGTGFPWKFGLLNRLTFGALDDAQHVQFACVAEAASS